jgi:alpha-glucosidase
MRIIQPSPLTLKESSLNGLKFIGKLQETFQITILEEDIIRVQHFPDGDPRFHRTWSIANESGDVPLEGRSREDLSSFSLPAYHSGTNDDLVQILTKELRIEIDTKDGSLCLK